ncbi:MAG: hypothetical protein XXXJIFNMEKO3_01370 [Candidatus Erwinia impunctatus]
MSSLPLSPTRKQVLKFIFESSRYGNLGTFIGAGFSKAVLNHRKKIALSWGELLEKAAEKLSVNYDSFPKVGYGFPELASLICRKYADSSGKSYDDSLLQLKVEIAALTSWYPDQECRDEYASYLETLSPAWIITTNYDLIIESLLLGKSIPLEPKDPLSSPSSVIPVYHLHGVRTNPESIIIAQEDYISLFRPNEYRQIKLALTIKESVTLLLGYGLGDVNVLTALDWSKNVFTHARENYPNDIIQVIKSDSPGDKPYRDAHGVIIIETSDLAEFFAEYSEISIKESKKKEREKENLKKLSDTLTHPGSDTIARFIDEEIFRKDILAKLSKFSIDLISGFISFLDKCIDQTWERSRPSCAFGGYNQNLNIILDILCAFPLCNFPPALLQTVVQSLERVAPLIGKEKGQSWEADSTWKKRRGELPPELVEELKNIAEQHSYDRVYSLICSTP